MDWLLYDNGLRHERVKSKSGNNRFIHAGIYLLTLNK